VNLGLSTRPDGRLRPLAANLAPVGVVLRRRYPSRLICALVVLALLGCVAPIFAAPTHADEVIVPNAKTADAPASGVKPVSGSLTFVAVLLLGGAGGWMLWRGRANRSASLGRAGRHLAVEETRSLGNRQYLVVASYQNRKFLLGVCPGRIDLLSPLDEPAAAGLERTRE